MADPILEAPYGTEVFIIVPDEYVDLVTVRKEHLRTILTQRFPAFDFSFGQGVGRFADDWAVMTVAGKVGDGWKQAAPVRTLDREIHEGIVGQLRSFVSGTTGLVN